MNKVDPVVVSRIQTVVESQASRKIREDVFIVEQEVPAEIEYDEYEESSTHIIATLHGEAVGTARWRLTSQGQKLERFAVLKSARGKHVGAALVEYILDQLETTETAYLNSQVSAIGFYSQFGFEETGGIFYEAGIPHRKMIRKI